MKKYVKVKKWQGLSNVENGKIYKIYNVKLIKNYISGVAIKIKNEKGVKRYYDAGFFKFQQIVDHKNGTLNFKPK